MIYLWFVSVFLLASSGENVGENPQNKIPGKSWSFNQNLL